MLVRWTTSPQREIGRLFDEVFSLANVPVAESWEPTADIAESESAYAITLEVPGVRASDLKIELDGNRLTVSGQKQTVREVNTERVYRSERRFGEFKRSFLLPETAKADGIVAHAADGVLTLTVPKAEAPKPKTIPVQVAAVQVEPAAKGSSN